MIFINRIPPPNPNVNYEGKTLPKDKVPLADVPVDPNVQYAGKTLPADKVQQVDVVIDPTNQPSVIVIGGYTLPPDTIIMLTGKKIIAKDAILDGVVVYEHIARHPYEIEFDVIVREDGAIPGYANQINTSGQQYTQQPFPQIGINNIWRQIWLPDSVQQIQNTYLNGLGILEVIIEEVRPTAVRGSKNIPLKIKAYENIPGQSIIISNSTTTTTG